MNGLGKIGWGWRWELFNLGLGGISDLSCGTKIRIRGLLHFTSFGREKFIPTCEQEGLRKSLVGSNICVRAYCECLCFFLEKNSVIKYMGIITYIYFFSSYAVEKYQGQSFLDHYWCLGLPSN